MNVVFLIILTTLTSFAVADSGLEGKGASLTVELRTLSRVNGVTIVGGVIKSSEFNTGLYFEPKNKLVNLEVAESCRSLAELAFAQNLKLTVKGELKKFEENFTKPSEVSFNESKALRCDLNRAKD